MIDAVVGLAIGVFVIIQGASVLFGAIVGKPAIAPTPEQLKPPGIGEPATPAQSAPVRSPEIQTPAAPTEEETAVASPKTEVPQEADETSDQPALFEDGLNHF